MNQSFPQLLRILTLLCLFQFLFFLNACDQKSSVGQTEASHPPRPADSSKPTDQITTTTLPNDPHLEVRTYTRVLCQSGESGYSPFIDTFLTNAPSYYFPANLPFRTKEGHSLNQILEVQILSGGSDTFDFVVSNFENNRKVVQVYFGTMNLLYRSTELTLLTESLPSDFFKSAPSLVGFSRKTYSLLVPDFKSNLFILRNSFSDQIISNVPLDPRKYFNPTLSPDSDVAIFQSLQPHARPPGTILAPDQRTQNSVYSLFTGEHLSFPFSPGGEHQYQAHFVNAESFAWVELINKELYLKVSTWPELLLGQARILAKVSSPHLNTYALGTTGTKIFLVRSFESYKNATDTKDVLYRQIESGHFEMTYWAANKSEAPTKIEVKYPQHLLDRRFSTNESLIHQISYSPWTNEWIGTTSRGIATFQWLKNQWHYSAESPGTGCHRIFIGPEYHVEEVEP